MTLTPAELIQSTREKIEECTVDDICPTADQQAFLIDVRELYEFEAAHIPGATASPRGMLEFEIGQLIEEKSGNVDPADVPIVLYCGTGGRSALAALSLNAMGYRNVRSLAGGIAAWTSAGHPVDSKD